MLGSGGTQKRPRDSSGTDIEPISSAFRILDKKLRMKDGSSGVAPLALRGGALPALPLHCVALFLGAFLLFAVEPMFTKMILPLLGGTPAVWNTAVMFFQAMLLGGYLYAHLLSRLSKIRWQVAVHASVLVVGLLFLPVHLAWRDASSGSAHPVAWLVALLAVSIGLPFFAVSATAPLLQRWFSRSGHVHASDPYFLYVSSNVGGLLALLAYPVLIEPRFGLTLQSRAWTAGYALLALTIVACAVSLHALRRLSLVPSSQSGEAAVSDPISWARRGRWVALSFVPSALLLAVTLHISTDVASVPFLWVAPLSLYMLSFIIVFARRPILKHNWMLFLQIPVYALLIVCFTQKEFLLVLGLHLLTLFVTAMVCHGELVRHRPPAEHLTEFYLWMSAGGLLGGVFCVLIAPVVFNSVLEYPLVLVLACLLRPESGGGLRRYLIDVGVVAVLGSAFFIAEPYVDPWSRGTTGSAIFCVAVALVLAGFRKRPVGLTLAFGMLLFSAISADKIKDQLYRQRSFFGVYTVAASGSRHDLYHGNITHGDQYMDAESVGTPTSYYNREGPLGQVFAAMRAVQPLKRVACVGLGTGTTACYQEPGQAMTFFEVDPAMARIARNPSLFRYLELYGENVNVVFGDGRQSIGRVADGTFDLIVLDAFSSDAIPVHLLTREALAIYMRKLAPGGIVLFHISNRYVNLEPVLANLAADAGYSALIEDYDPNQAEKDSGGSSSTWVAVAHNDGDLVLLATDDRWGPPQGDDRVGLWTDDYSDLFRTLIWRELFRSW